MVVIQYSQCPTCGRNVSLWVGGLDVKANFVPKIDIVGLALVALLDRMIYCFCCVARRTGVYVPHTELECVVMVDTHLCIGRVPTSCREED